MRILIIQLRRIGDVLLTTPVLSYLKRVFPEATLDFLVEPAAKTVLENNPHINTVLIYDRTRSIAEIKRLRVAKYDVVIDFMNNPRTAYITGLSGARWRVGFKSRFRSLFYNVAMPDTKIPEYVPRRKLRLIEYWLKKMGQSIPPLHIIRPQLFLSLEDERFADDWRKKENIGAKPYTIIIPTHRHPIRRWRKEGFRDVALHLATEAGHHVFFAWGPGEEDLIQDIRSGHEDKLGMLPLTTLRQFGAIAKGARLAVTNDSGLMHIAVAVECPTVTIYGPTRPIDWNPSLTEHRCGIHDIAVNAGHVPCLGCHLLQCPIGHICMKELDAVAVINACQKLVRQ